MELISKIPEGEVCNYLGIMDTLGGPANFRPNCRIRSRCGRRFIGRVDGTYKLRFLFHPYGQPDLSLFLIPNSSLLPFYFSCFSSSITNLYRLFHSQKTLCKNLNSKYLYRETLVEYFQYRNLLTYSIDINRNSKLEKKESNLSRQIHKIQRVSKG